MLSIWITVSTEIYKNNFIGIINCSKFSRNNFLEIDFELDSIISKNKDKLTKILKKKADKEFDF